MQNRTSQRRLVLLAVSTVEFRSYSGTAEGGGSEAASPEAWWRSLHTGQVAEVHISSPQE